MNQTEWKLLQRRFEMSQSGWPTLLVIVVDTMLVTASMWLRARGGFFYLVSVGCLTVALLHAYLLLHEASHSAISSNKFINSLVGHVAGWLIAMPYLSRRRSHM